MIRAATQMIPSTTASPMTSWNIREVAETDLAVWAATVVAVVDAVLASVVGLVAWLATVRKSDTWLIRES